MDLSELWSASFNVQSSKFNVRIILTAGLRPPPSDSAPPAAFDRQLGENSNETTKQTKNTKSERVMICLVRRSMFASFRPPTSANWNYGLALKRAMDISRGANESASAAPGLGTISPFAPAGAMDLSEL